VSALAKRPARRYNGKNGAKGKWAVTKEQLVSIVETQGMNLLHGILVLVVGFFVVHWVLKLMERSRAVLRIEPTLRGFLENLIRIVLYVTVVLTAAGAMGIPLTSFVTILASAGVAISLAT